MGRGGTVPPHKNLGFGSKWDEVGPSHRIKTKGLAQQLGRGGSVPLHKNRGFGSRWDKVGPSHPTKIVGLGAGGTRWDRPTPIKLTGGKRWDRQTQFSMRWDRPNPVSGLKNYKKRKGWGMGWSLGHRRCAPWGLVTAPSVVVIRLRFQTGSVLLRQFRVSSKSISVHPGMEQSSSSLTRTQLFIDIH